MKAYLLAGNYKTVEEWWICRNQDSTALNFNGLLKHYSSMATSVASEPEILRIIAYRPIFT